MASNTLQHFLLVGLFAIAAAISADRAPGIALTPDSEVDTYEPGRVRAAIVSDEIVEYLDPIKLGDGRWFTPYVRNITVIVNENDLDQEALRMANSQAHDQSDDNRGIVGRSVASLTTTNCSFQVIQRLPDVAIGRASQSPICTEKDPVSTHLWGHSGQVYSGLSAAGWGSDYCGPYTQPNQYLWIDDHVSLGFYQNYSGWAKGSCAGTRNHVRL